MSNAKIASFIQQWRLYLVLFVMFLCVVAIGWKVSALHIIERDFLQSQGDARTIRTVPLVANRGVITDRNGEPLAVSSPVKSIWVNPQEIGNKPSQIQRLATGVAVGCYFAAGSYCAKRKTRIPLCEEARGTSRSRKSVGSGHRRCLRSAGISKILSSGRSRSSPRWVSATLMM